MIDRIAASICYQMYTKQLYSHTQIRQIQYGLQSMISEIIKTIFMCIVLYLSGYLKYGVFAMLVFSSIRVWAGGYHADTYLKCFVISLGIMYLAIISGLYIQNNIVFLVEALFSFWIIYKFCPADHKNQPILSNSRRKKIHIIALGIFIFWFCILFILPSPWKYIGMTSIFIETLTIVYMIVVKREQMNIVEQK